MNKRTDSLILLLLVFAVLVVALNAWIAFQAEDQLARSEVAVTHTWQAIHTVERTLNDVESIETGARGYLISEDPQYLQPYTNGMAALPSDLQHFRDVTRENPRQQARAADLQQAVKARTDLLEQQIRLQQSGDREAALAMIHGGAGEQQMMRLRVVVASMQQEEAQALSAREADLAHARAEARFTVGLASALDLLLILLSGAWLSRERSLREHARSTAERLERLQSIIDASMSALDITAQRSEILQRLRAVAHADSAAIYAYHTPDGSESIGEDLVIVEAATGVELAAGTVFPLWPDGPLARSRDANTVVRLVGPEVQQLPTGEFSHSVGTLLILHLRTLDTRLGFIVLGHHQENAFSAEDEELLRVAADRIAVSIDRARLFNQERQAREAAEASSAEVGALNAELEERVRHRTLELETTNRELEAFAYSVSHDLRAPLRSVDGFSVALAEDYGASLQGDGQHYLSRIRAGVQRMGTLIDALLQLSRITRADLSPEETDLSALAFGVADELKQTNPGRQLEFVIEPGLRATADGHLLSVVFENMFGNAVKFTGRVERARIEFGWSPEKQAYYIRDNGAGFDQQYAEKLFVAFQRLHGDKDFQGSGIGLATVARVIHRHHGTIQAEGVEGHGATFWFTLR